MVPAISRPPRTTPVTLSALEVSQRAMKCSAPNLRSSARVASRPRFIEIDRGDAGAGLREAQRSGAADAAASARHHAHTA